MTQPIIEFIDFSFKYDSQQSPTLKEISLSISKGEKILIVGASGSGKSTLSNCLNGLIPHAYHGTFRGELRIRGQQATRQSIFARSKHIGSVLQDTDGQFVGLTTAEDIAFALENDAIAQNLMFSRIKKVAELVDIKNLLSHSPQDLSGGQKQRVSLAGVLVDDVDILLFDEPLANLDPKTGQTAIQLIDDINQQGKTIIIIEHRLEDALVEQVDRIIVMDHGEIIMDAKPDEVLSSAILTQVGVREPLYVEACKLAEISISPDMHPSHAEKFELGIQSENLKNWHKTHEQAEQNTDKEVILSLQNISFAYDEKPILENVSLDIHAGEMLSIVGKNGSGKSTLSKLIVGFETPQTGELFYQNSDLSTLSIKERAEYIGIVLQNPNHMISETMIVDEVALGLHIRGVAEDKITAKVSEVLDICGLKPFAKWPISALSYGQRKRVTIAAILALDPKILILDEPTAGQDYRHYAGIMDFLEHLNAMGITIVLITHDMHLMLEYTPRAVVVGERRILADDKAYRILYNDDIIERANLKKTSLYQLARTNGLDPDAFIHTFIAQERKTRHAI